MRSIINTVSGRANSRSRPRSTVSRAKTLKLLLGRSWDGPVASQQLNPETDARIGGGGGFATAAGDLGATIGRLCGRPRPAGSAAPASPVNPWQ